MVLSKCYGFIKCALVCINLTFLAIGLGIIVLAVWMLTDQTFLMHLAQDHQDFMAGLYILLTVGIAMLITSFLGCFGALRESKCMLVTFFSCLLVIIVGRLAAGAWLYTNSGVLEELVKSSLINTVKNEYGEQESHTQIMDVFQMNLKCCGATGPADWAGSKYATKDPSIPVSLTVSGDNNVYKIPESCCKDMESDACKLARHIKIAGIISPAIYSEGCMDKMMEQLHSQLSIVIGVALGIEILQLLALIFSLILCCAIGSPDRYKA